MMTEKVKDFIEVVPFKRYVDFRDLEITEEKERLVRGYIITKDVHKGLRSFLDIVREIRKSREKTLLIVGSYGTGKSHLLAFSSLILESLRDDKLFKLIHSKLKKDKGLWQQISLLKSKGLRVLPVKINMKIESETESIYGVVIKNLRKAVKEYLRKDLTLAYEWEEWLDIIQNRMKKEDQSRLVKTLKNKRHNFHDIIDLLKLRDYKAIEILTEAFTEEFGFSPRPITMDIKTIYEQAWRSLKKDCDGIVFLIDELQKYLESSKKADSDLTYLEAMCEETEGKPIVVMPSVLELKLARKYDWGRTYDKFVSRFEQHLLTLEGLDKIISSRLKFTKELPKKLGKEPSTKILTAENFKILSRLYPLNPITFRLLRKVTEIRAAERSAFTFLLDIYNTIGMRPFVESDGKLALITPDMLYEYFGDDLVIVASDVISEVNTLLGTVKNEQKPYVKYMGITTVMEERFNRKDFSQAFLDRDDFVLKQMGKIIGSRPRSFEVIELDEIYAIRPITGAVRDVIKEFKRKVKKPLESLVENLNTSYLGTISQKIQGVERSLKIEFCLLKAAEKHLKKQVWPEIRLLVVIPETEVRLKDPQIRKLLKLAGDHNIILFVVKQKIANLESVREYFAVRQALSERPPRLLERDVKSILSNTEVLFRSLFSSDNLSVWYKGNKIRKPDLILIADGLKVNNDFLENILDEVFKRLYPNYFKLWTGFKGDVDFTTRTPTNKIIRNFLSKGSMIGPPSMMTQVRNLAKPAGFAQERGGKFFLTLPKEGDVGIQRKIIDEIFTQIKKNPDFIKLYDLLSKAPYGFPDPLIEMYLGALLANRKVLIKDRDRQLIKIDLSNPKEVQDVIRNSKKGTVYNISITRVFPKEKWVLIKEFLTGVVEEPSEILKQKIVTEDQILELKEVLEERLEYHREKLLGMKDFLSKYEVETSRIQRKLKTKGESI